ncbi:stage III sporulation protein AD [Sporolactobacillus terrae]|uniref:Stage III sporulation protein AD n=1 Tax=Sporolactobacillus terrae TaxID=269673 RepID=A0A410D9D7_9BACL|nr:stage III sporulation protein AD [Sporolactobacillus terrae]QAA22734.1 stage III sporulation protein AD [Sporolactobacillus terrae]QAA25707.1 stage III sporulation protein AD [Sporolactobacillus terrae]UAK17520.1 stage III sporulation protein AD [Sporolactobacillus terrae]BBN99068.1 stage III sporulation protein AD [Sporolactobacillus terrae]
MDILQIVGLGLSVTFLTLILKQRNPVFALVVSLIAGVFILLMMIDQIRLVMEMLKNMAQTAHLNNVYVATILKIIGIAYISEFGAQIAKDAGQSSMAGKIELAGKLIILVMAIPILTAIVETVMNLMPQVGGG